MEKLSIINYQKELKNRSANQKKGIYRYEQELAKTVCDYLGDFKEFGLWVRKAKELGAGEFKVRFDYMVEKKIKNSHYLLKSCK